MQPAPQGRFLRFFRTKRGIASLVGIIVLFISIGSIASQGGGTPASTPTATSTRLAAIATPTRTNSYSGGSDRRTHRKGYRDA